MPACAAFMLHADGAARDEVALYLRRRLLTTRCWADEILELIEDPTYRTQILAGHEGERLLHRWFELGPASERVDRYGRFMREQVTPALLWREAVPHRAGRPRLVAGLRRWGRRKGLSGPAGAREPVRRCPGSPPCCGPRRLRIDLAA